MCTITFVPRPSGYYLAMNRDEQHSRVHALPPTVRFQESRRVLSPSEPNGGTWISLNDAGVTFALLNWYSVPATVPGLPISRGRVVQELASETALSGGDSVLRAIPLKRVRPFRLIGVFPDKQQVHEWRWNSHCLKMEKFAWKRKQWASSGFDEPRAQQVRQRTFVEAQQQKSLDTLVWLRRLHRSHRPERGPFSICMHRSDATTVSYSEVLVIGNNASLRYANGPPCERAPLVSLEL